MVCSGRPEKPNISESVSFFLSFIHFWWGSLSRWSNLLRGRGSSGRSPMGMKLGGSLDSGEGRR